MIRFLKFLSVFFVVLCLHDVAKAQCSSDEYVSNDGLRCIKRAGVNTLHLPREHHCQVGFFDVGKGDNRIGSTFYYRMKNLEKTNPEQCGVAKKEYEQDKAAREKYDYSSETSRGLRSATSSLASQMSRPNTEAIRRKEAWKRKQALKQADYRRKQAENKARRNAMLAEAKRLNADYEACKKRNRICSRGTRR